MTDTATPLPLRNDTILGVCEAIGTDFGFHPNWLRIAFAGVLFFSPAAAFGLYFGLGAIVAITRWIAPNTNVDAATMTVDAVARELPEEEVRLAA